MREAKRFNLFKSYFVGKDKVEVNLLQYAYDTLFVGETSLENVITIKTILRCFEVVSVLKVNFHWSSYGVVGRDRREVEAFVDLLNYRTMSLPLVYFGVARREGGKLFGLVGKKFVVLGVMEG